MKVDPKSPLNPIRNVFNESSTRTQNGRLCGHNCFPSLQIKCDIHWVQTLIITTVRLYNWEGGTAVKPCPELKAFSIRCSTPQNKTCMQLKCCKDIHKGVIMLFFYMLPGITWAKSKRHSEISEWNQNKTPLRCFLTSYFRPRWLGKWCSFYQLLIYELTKFLQQVRTELRDERRRQGQQ